MAVLALGIFIGVVFFGGNKDADEKATAAGEVVPSAWTCSMHPNVEMPESGDCPLCGMALVERSATMGLTTENQFTLSEEAVALSNITTTKVAANRGEGLTIKLSGLIQPNKKTNSVQTTLYNGRIEKLDVNFVGEYVKKGQQVGLIYSPELYAAQDQLLTSASYKGTHEKLFNAARNNLGLWKLSDEQINTILETKKPMFNFPIYADVSGTVTEIFASEGNYYKQGDPLFKLSDLSLVWAVMDVHENQLSFLKTGQKIVIRASAIKDRDWKGTIDFIEPILDTSKRTVALRVSLNNPGGILKPGMFVEGNVEIEGNKDILTIPRSAVLWTGQRSLVYLKSSPSQPVFEMREVVLGDALDDHFQVLSGLEAGDEVVVNGAFTLDAAAQLQRKRSMMGSGAPLAGSPVYEEKALHFDSKTETGLPGILATYMKLKDGLVSGSMEVRNTALELSEQLNLADLTAMDGNQQDQLKQLKAYADSIGMTPDLARQRLYFKPFSGLMVAVVSDFEGLQQPLYVQYCPMADGNKGASWLSKEAEIRNPYFGEKMLNCGKIISKLE